MSAFPYSVASPPPTAGPLPVIERANLNTPYSGGGGGGGPIGPNPVVSTLTTNSGWFGGLPSTFDIVGGGQGLAIGGNAVEALAISGSTLQEVGIIGGNLNQIVIVGGQLERMVCESGLAKTQLTSMTLNISTPNFYLSNFLPAAGTNLEIQSDSVSTLGGASTCCGSLELGALPDGRSYVGAALGYSVSSLSTLLLLGDGVNISSLNVSSINGAAPGGSVPPNLSVSTLNVAGLASVSSLTGVTGAPLTLDGQGQAINVAATTVNIPAAPVTISTAIISSINGVAYPPAGAALQFSSIGIPGGVGLSSFVCDPNATTQLVSFSTTAGHVYSASVGARAQVFVTAANGDTIYTEILDNNAGNDAIGNWSAQMVSTIAAGGSYQYVGGSVTWKAGGTGASFSCNPSVSTNIRIDAINLIDFGAI